MRWSIAPTDEFVGVCGCLDSFGELLASDSSEVDGFWNQALELNSLFEGISEPPCSTEVMG
jgi:hypothetical protein